MKGNRGAFQRGTFWWIAYYDEGREHRESSGSRERKEAVNLQRAPLGRGNGQGGSACTEEVKALLPCLPAYLRNYVPFGFLTRWRKGEIVGLGWTNVDRSGEIRLDPEP